MTEDGHVGDLSEANFVGKSLLVGWPIWWLVGPVNEVFQFSLCCSHTGCCSKAGSAFIQLLFWKHSL